VGWCSSNTQKFRTFGINFPQRGISPGAIFLTKFGVGEAVPGPNPHAKFQYCGFDKNLDIENRSRVSCAHNSSKGISVILKSTLRVTQAHWKRNHWTDHTRLTVRRVIGHWFNIVVTLKCGSEVTQGHWKWYHLKVWVRLPNFSYPNPTPVR